MVCERIVCCKLPVLLFKHFKGCKHCYSALIILFNINNLFKLNIYALIKKATFPHEREPL